MSTTALIIGATGLIGKSVLPALLSSPHFSRVGEFGRRVTKPVPSGAENGKLVQHTIDFEKLGESPLKEEKWDVVYICLGTSKAIAGSREAFIKIDKDYVVNAAKEARVLGQKQRLVYLSGEWANPSSSALYLRTKGETEKALAEIGYDDFISLRPGVFLNADRTGTSREGEDSIFRKAVIFLVSFFHSVDVKDVAIAFRLAGELGTQGLPKVAEAVSLSSDPSHPHTVINNPSIAAFAQTAR